MSQIQIQKPRFEEWARALETSPYRQIHLCMTDGKNGRCAMGALIEAIGPDFYNGMNSPALYDDFTKRATEQGHKDFIMFRNDRGDSFQEIANWIRTIR